MYHEFLVLAKKELLTYDNGVVFKNI